MPGYFCEDGKTVKFSSIAADETAMLVVFKPTDDKGSVIKFVKLVKPGGQKSILVNTQVSTLINLQAEIKSKLSDI